MLQNAEDLAAALERARRTVTPVDGAVSPWTELTSVSATEVGAALCRLIGADGSPFWKLGAVDQDTQARLGLLGPIFAPLDPASVRHDVITAEFDRSTLIAPRFEPEIGVVRVNGVLRAAPCVEIADSRFAGWRLPPWGVVADATLQGHMLFGPATSPVGDIEVTVRFNDREMARGRGTWREAVARLDLLPGHSSATHVATGSLTPLFDCEPGVWSFGFGSLGTLSVHVV